MKSIAVITGASRGIGLATARRLSAEFDVVSLSRTEATGITTYRTDITQPGEVAEAFGKIAEQHGTPEVLVNNAGFVEPKGLLEMSLEDWATTVAVNLTGAFICTQQFVRHARRHGRGGKIVNIASTAGTRPQPGWSAYAAAKAGVINFSLSMAEELRPYGIRVYCVAPGRCATDLRRRLAPDEDQSTIMQPAEVAEFIHHLIIDGRLVDGQTILVRG